MAELYPRWVAAHGFLIVCPVHWYQAPASLKLMMDRLVCADGGNPDPTTTHGKDPLRAKQLELAGWSYPKHLARRAFAVVAHGDASGPENLRRMLVDWLTDMGLVQAGLGRARHVHRLLPPYATSHDDLDADTDVSRKCGTRAGARERGRPDARGDMDAARRGLHEPREK